MKLIDLDAFRKEHRMNERCETCEQDAKRCQYSDYSMMDFCGWLDDASTVDAVPINPLSAWLAGYAAPPKYALETVIRDGNDPASIAYTANDRAKAWELHLKTLIESGLMEESEV